MSVEALRSLRQAVQKKDGDPFENGTVIQWRRKYETAGRGGRKVYTYAALRAAGKWYVTGANSPREGILYSTLVRMLSEDGVRKIAVATEWSTIDYSTSPRAKMAAERAPRHRSGCKFVGMEITSPVPDCGCPVLP